MIRLKELHRRFEQILGVPKIPERDRHKFTINARMTRLEEQLNQVNLKLDLCLNILNSNNNNNTNI
jgi:hypothetical protein